MNRLSRLAVVTLISVAVVSLPSVAAGQAFWSQWGRERAARKHGQHWRSAAQQQACRHCLRPVHPAGEERDLAASCWRTFKSALIDGNSFYMMQKSGNYPSCRPLQTWVYGFPCGPNAWNKVQWNVVRRDWQQGTPVIVWTYPTDWKPEPNATNYLQGFGGLGGWEPVFHPALANGFLYVPGAAGTIWKVNTTTGQTQTHINPFSGGSISAANTFVSGPVTADANGNIYYNVIELNINGNPWAQNDVINAWLVKITPGDAVSYGDLRHAGTECSSRELDALRRRLLRPAERWVATALAAAGSCHSANPAVRFAAPGSKRCSCGCSRRYGLHGERRAF